MGWRSGILPRFEMNRDEIIQRVRDAGVVGAGGGGFPTNIKLSCKVDTVIANGAECEPLLQGDKYLMINKPEDIIQGLKLAMVATGAQRGYIALKEKYTNAISALQDNLKKDKQIGIYKLSDFYPAGDEHNIVKEVTQRYVPEGGIPPHAGIIVQNVETLINIAKAWEGTPIVERVITIAGEVNNPKITILPVGMKVKDAISFAGGARVSDFKVIAGGPMMGKIIDHENDTIDKTINSLIILEKNHPLIMRKSTTIKNEIKRGNSACDQCLACTELCPRFLLGQKLEPHKIMRSVSLMLEEPKEVLLSANLCCECGICEFACTLNLSPRAIIREIKKILREKDFQNVHVRTYLSTHEMREFRKMPMERIISRCGIKSYDKPLRYEPYGLKPESIKINLKQHAGVKAIAVVREGERVKKGSLIGNIPSGSVGARVHSSMDGRISCITENYIEIIAEN